MQLREAEASAVPLPEARLLEAQDKLATWENNFQRRIYINPHNRNEVSYRALSKRMREGKHHDATPFFRPLTLDVKMPGLSNPNEKMQRLRCVVQDTSGPCETVVAEDVVDGNSELRALLASYVMGDEDDVASDNGEGEEKEFDAGNSLEQQMLQDMPLGHMSKLATPSEGGEIEEDLQDGGEDGADTEAGEIQVDAGWADVIDQDACEGPPPFPHTFVCFHPGNSLYTCSHQLCALGNIA